MSTKMYSLYKTSMNLAQLDTWLQQLKEKHMEHLIEQIAPFAKKIGTQLKAETGIEHDLFDTINDHTTKGYRSPFNIDASVVVYIDGRTLYVQFFGVRHSMYEKEVGEGLLADFHYQNQTDMPDTISAQEWNKRRKVVDRLLNKDDSGIPSRCGFYRVLSDKNDCMKVAMYVEEYLESKEGKKRMKEQDFKKGEF